MIKRIVIVIIGIIVVVLGRGFFFYSGLYTPPPTEMPSYEDVVVPPAPSSEFSDNVSDNISEEEKAVLIDLAHDNNFDKEELNVLILRLISRDLSIKFFGVEDDLKKELLGEEEEEIEEEEEPLGEEEEEQTDQEEEPLGEEEEEIEEEEEPLGEEEGEEKIDQEEEPLGEEEGEEKIDQEEEPLGEEEGEEKIDQEEEPLGEEVEEEEELLPVAFIIVSPQVEFSKEEKKTVNEFVDNGGKLLLIADPTRNDNINSISLEFGLIFEPDYLYNMEENEINYRNIFVSEFEENEITKNIEKIVLYVAGSISSADGGIAFVDQNTFSSIIESRKQLSPIALNQDEKVMAVHDLTFMTEPYNGALDNNQLIANIADWLASPAEEEEAAESNEKG